MIGIVVVTALFVVMFAAPFAGAMVYCAARDEIGRASCRERV